jgi:asparagine synthase (glutamine-hydrolysing)
MCGINGILFKVKEKNRDLRGLLTKMNDLIIHRGPDDYGVYSEDDRSYELAMGMRRLSIIDLTSGAQPITSEDDSIIIVFNGEIYNYQALRLELLHKGVVFKTNSDTEVVLQLYKVFGVAGFGSLDGMFAFSIYDKNSDKIFIARDFFGEKPLYFFKNDERLLWGSELKSLKNIFEGQLVLNKNALSLYFQLTYIPAPFTIYENVHKLKPNHYVEFDCNTFKLGQFEIKQRAINVQYGKPSFEEAKRITHDLVQKSVQSRAVSDVPIGTFLSGGVDSSIVSLALSLHKSTPINTFSIGFEKKSFDETDKSKIVAKLIGSKHHAFKVSKNDLKNDIHSVLLNFDEPFADSSALPSFLVSKRAQKHVKVALTGDGGDEVFGGYNKYYIGKLNKKYTSIVPEKLHELLSNSASKLFRTIDDDRGIRFKLSRLLKAVDYENDFYYNIISLGFQKSELSNLLKSDHLVENSLDYYKLRKNLTLKDFRNIDKSLSLEGDMLVKLDRTSMLSSLECRAPFLNKEIWNFTNQMPDSYLMKGWRKKHLLKESFKDYFPKGFLEKSKQGFGVPVGDWLRSLLREELEGYVAVNFLKEQGVFNIDFTRKMVLDHTKGKVDNTFRVWSFFCFQKWYINQ